MRDYSSFGVDPVVQHEMPRGITAIGVFLFFGATRASVAGGDIDLGWHIPRLAVGSQSHNHKQLGRRVPSLVAEARQRK